MIWFKGDEKMTEKRFIGYFVGDTLVSIKDTVTNKRLNILQIVKVANKISDENEQLKKYNKGQELEIIRLHNLADAMSAVLRELGIYDVYNDEQIENVKRRIINV